MQYYIGIDAGGTKTEAILADQSGHIVRRTVNKGCNPMDIGVAETKSHILTVVKELADTSPETPVSVYGGIAGLDRIDVGMDAFLSENLPIPVIRTEDDGCNMISGMLGHTDGCGMVCGTGSSLFARIEGKPLVHIGGLGYLIDTGGSGYELAQDGLKQAYRYLDGRGEKTLLAERFADAIGSSMKYAFADIYGGGRPYIASLAHVVFECAADGDEISLAILDKGAFKLAELTHAAAKHFDGRFTVVMNGGIFTAYPHYAEAVKAKASPRADMIKADVPAIYGAVVEALWQNGVIADKSTRERFLDDYSRITK
ncbi:MAG: hypothetical protein IJF25_02095 [Oscillospiraceae bacterium]|nr:hypothetical protein [Oscillospiraceae bacterium]MBQ4538477.1 hypothetical protein [Oscillospiraceae bacterium]